MPRALSRRCTLVQLGQAALFIAVPQPARTQAAGDEVSAAEFWALYHQGRFVQWQRGPQGCQGQVRQEPLHGRPQDLLSVPTYRQVRISKAALAAYDDALDPAFVRLASAQLSWAQLWAAASKGQVQPWQAAPYAPERMQEVLGAAANPGSVQGAARLLTHSLASGAAAAPLATALAWLLGESRHVEGAGALLATLRVAGAGSPALDRLPFALVDAAFAALAKVDNKAFLPQLLSLMQAGNSSVRHRFARLLERWLSAQHMLSLHALGDAFSDPRAWARLAASRQARNALQWQRESARSLHWDLRGLAALRLPLTEAALLEELAHDEAGPVRRIARARL